MIYTENLGTIVQFKRSSYTLVNKSEQVRFISQQGTLYTSVSTDSIETLKMRKSVYDRLIFELYQLARKAFKRPQTRPGNFFVS